LNEETLIKRIFYVMTNRLLILFVCFCIMFYLLVVKLFDIQIINAGTYSSSSSIPSFRTMELSAQRGTIFDRHGRPLAVNEVAMILKIDPAAIETGDTNRAIYELIKLLERNEEEYFDDFPISLNKPYTFLMNGSESRERRFKRDMDLPEDLTAEECIVVLRRRFNIPEDMSVLDARKVIGLRSEIYMRRFRKHEHITVAFGISERTLVIIEENNEIFPGIYADYDFLRHYPEGLYTAHIVGYIRGLTEERELDLFGEGYSYGMLVGKTGVELTFENELSGNKGSKLVEVSNSGRELRSIPVTNPEQGNKIFLTIDARLQRRSYEIIEDTLKEIIINKLRGLALREEPITTQQFFISLLRGTAISIADIYDADDSSRVVPIRDYLRTELPDMDTSLSEDISKIRFALTDALRNNRISPNQMTFVLYEQGYIVGDDAYIARFLRGGINTLNVIIDCLENKTITPQMTGLDPSTGSVIIVCVKTGDVLAAVGYPSYDTNKYVNTMDVDYFVKQQNDPSRPQYDRVFWEQRAPGSTFKMLSAIAGLESGTISSRSTYYDGVSWEKAGRPYTRCWSSVSHGSINVSTALEVSCNYFFCEMSFAMAGGGREFESIRTLNKYMIDFGLNGPTGVEINEPNQNLEDDALVIASPEFKRTRVLGANPNARAQDYTWFAGDTVRTSIGQSLNNYTTASMAKYISTLATGGIRQKLNLVARLETHRGELVKDFAPVVETVVDMRQETINAVHTGMLAVTRGGRGTATAVFNGFPIQVAGKTGTAEEISNRPDHSSFGGFAPYDEPEVAVYVMLPFGSTQAVRNASAVVTRRVLEEYFGLETEPERPRTVNILAR
jgi:cell division protein FtsI/penicillin-binding protein 2